METTSKPRYNLWQNTAFMLREAWHTRKSVIFLCVTLAAAMAGQSVAELLDCSGHPAQSGAGRGIAGATGCHPVLGRRAGAAGGAEILSVCQCHVRAH